MSTDQVNISTAAANVDMYPDTPRPKLDMTELSILTLWVFDFHQSPGKKKVRGNTTFQKN
jgi:hypothetical protein